MGTVWRDLRFAVRTLLRSPGFAVVVVLTLAVGIGANASIFTLIDAYFLRPLPGVSDPDRLVEVQGTQHGRHMGAMAYPDYADLREQNRVFSGVMAYRPTVLDLGSGNETRRVQAALVSSNYFAVLGTSAVLGRTFLPEEERPAGAHPLAVISHGLWQRRFGADSTVVGKTVTLNGRGFTVVGVTPGGFRGHAQWDAYDVWVPLAMHGEASPEALASLDNRVWRWLRVVGRLERGVNLTQARAGMNTLARQLEQSGAGKGEGFGVLLEPFRAWLDVYVELLIAGVAVLLLIVCANLSNLFLARASARRREIATRLALGAGRGRVIQQLLAESVLLGVLGGVAGLLVANPTANALLAWSAVRVGEFADVVDLRLDAKLVGFVALVSIFSGVAFGLGPALRGSRVDVAASLKEGGGGWSAGSSRLRGLLVVSQLSLSLVLLSGGGLLFTTLRNLQGLVAIPEPEQVLLVALQPSHQRYSDAKARVFYRQLLERVEAVPGVRSVSLARDVSLGDRSFFTEHVAAELSESSSDESRIDAHYNVVAPKYFQTMGVVLAAGREFTAQDAEGAPPVAIVNRALARRLWPGRDPLGQRLRIANESSGREVVGLVNDRATRDGPEPYFYEPLFDRYPWAGSSVTLHIRTSGSPLALLPAVRREALALDPNLPLFNPRTLEREIAGSRSDERLIGAVVGVSGVLALLLAAIGLYGVTSYAVAQRTQEIGVRMALGARARDVLVEVVRQGMKLALGGVAIGLAAALAVNRVWTSLLYGVSPAEPAVLAGVLLLLTGTALVASYLPARRATKVDPLVALRYE